MKIKCFLVLLFLFISTPAISQDLCAKAKDAAVNEAPELKFDEKDLNISEAMQSIKWLESDIWKVIKKYKTTKELVNCQECFDMPLLNHVLRVKGALLRQQALLEKERLETAKLKTKTGSGNKEDLKQAQIRFDVARKNFCKFIKDAELAD
jgi:hypothetical protein